MAEKLLAEEADASAEEANGDVEDQSDSDEPKKDKKSKKKAKAKATSDSDDGKEDSQKEDDIALVGGGGWNTVPVAHSVNLGCFRNTNNRVTDFPAWAAIAGVQAVAGDFNHDGKGDIALNGANRWGTLPTAFGNGDGTFRVTNKPI